MIDILVLSILFSFFMSIYIFKKGITYSKVVLFSFLLVIALPKINIIGGTTSITTAGVRLDDIIILLLFIYTLIKFRGVFNPTINALIVLFALLIFNGTISGVYAWIRQDSNSLLNSILVPVRYFEYFCFAIVASKLNKSNSFKKLFMNSIRLLVVFLSFVSILQYLEMANYYVGGHEAGNFFGGLAAATFNGYYEYGCFCVLMCYFFLVSSRKIDYVFLLLSFSQILLTQSRTSLLICVVLIFVFIFKNCFWCDSRRMQKFYISVLSLTVIVGTGAIIIAANRGLLDRLTSVNIDSIISQFEVEWDNRDFYSFVEYIKTGTDYVGNASQTGDYSFNIRLYKWASCLDGFLLFPLFGYGAGVTPTLDGNYVKLLCEQGIIGFVLWFTILFYTLGHINTKKNYFIGFLGCLMIASLTIDMFEASKIMQVFWFMGGMMISNNNILLYKDKKHVAQERLQYATN